MPPPKGPAKHFPGESHHTFDEGIGHSVRILFADLSLPIPKHAEAVLPTYARSSAEALFYYAQIAHLEKRKKDGKVEVVCMAPDPDDKSELGQVAIERFRAIAYEPITDVEGHELDLDLTEIPREDRMTRRKLGFYSLIADASKRLVVVRTPSVDPYDCAFVESGHAQTGSNGIDEFERRLSRYKQRQS